MTDHQKEFDFNMQLIRAVNSKKAEMEITLDGIWRKTRDMKKVEISRKQRLATIERWRIAQLAAHVKEAK